jgi:hypothetical protein
MTLLLAGSARGHKSVGFHDSTDMLEEVSPSTAASSSSASCLAIFLRDTAHDPDLQVVGLIQTIAMDEGASPSGAAIASS